MEGWQRPAPSASTCTTAGSRTEFDFDLNTIPRPRKCVQFADTPSSRFTDIAEEATKGLSGFRSIAEPGPSRSCLRGRRNRASFDHPPRKPAEDDDNHLATYLDAVAIAGPSVTVNSHGRRSISVDNPYSGAQGTSHVVSKEYSDVESLFRFDVELGRGASGIVRLCLDGNTGEEFACKSIAKASLKCALDVQNLQTEVRALQAMQQHPKVVGLKDVYEDPKKVHVVMEFCEGGDLFSRIKQRRYFTEPEAASICASLASVLAFAHQRGIMHRDLKPENILLVSRHLDTEVRVADFGSAAFFKKGKQLNQLIGSPLYIAPSVLRYSYGPEADLWSLGVVLYILLCGVPPFWGPTTVDILRSVQYGEVELEKGRWKFVSKGAKKLVSRLLNRDDSKRITASQVLKHPWILHFTGEGGWGKAVKKYLKIPPIPAKPARHMSAKEASASKAAMKAISRRRRAYSLSSDRDLCDDSQVELNEESAAGAGAVGVITVQLKSVLNRTPTPYRLVPSGSDGDDDGGSGDEGVFEREETLTTPDSMSKSSKHCQSDGMVAVSKFFGGGASQPKHGDILDFRE